ncbi:hypothetical protein BDV98DRAFT_652521 [Pterulicium gracile]|uniref:TEA domain-containing protein n=1 Tax=Pterulicium gracile TaxID=1884261 RepID=A0A5C3R1U0_9AGAR|nr:hypothetical protein BDV98DRAFT_652521 [Pterula gracilis]
MPVSSASKASSSTSIISTTLTPQRKHHKLLKDGSGDEVWPQSVESVFVQGLKAYRDSPWATYSRGRSRWRNQFLVDYLQSVGIVRTKKQVASHIQVLRNMWKGEPDFELVSGGEVSAQLQSQSKPTSRSKQKSSTPVKSEEEQKPLFNFSSPSPTLLSPSPAQSLYEPSEAYPKAEYSPSSSAHSSPLSSHSVPTVLLPYLDQGHLSMPYMPIPNTLTSLHISSPGITPVSVPVDLTAVGSSIPVFKFSLVPPSSMDYMCPVDMEGFDAQLSMLQPWSRCRTLTRVFSAGSCISQEYTTTLPGSQQHRFISASSPSFSLVQVQMVKLR